MSITNFINKPWYLFRPRQALRAVRARSDEDQVVLAPLPWQTSIEVYRHDPVGSSVIRRGVYDMALTEVLWRLADGGETALDIGAHVGYVAATLAARAGRHGLVLAIEPSPLALALLRRNIARWNDQPHLGRIQLAESAVSRSVGSARLRPPSVGNLGTASIDVRATDKDAIDVPTTTLDQIIGEIGPVGVAKIDVEGHEQEVIEGGRRSLAAGLVRDIVFEEHRGYDAPAQRLLEALGYRVFGITHSVFGPLTRQPERGPAVSGPYEAPSLLATRDEVRARQRLSGRGWRSLRP